jgi:hypothetical protein
MRVRRRGAVGCAVLFGALLVDGCAASRPPSVHRPPGPLPSVAQLDAALAARRSALQGLRALARLRYTDGPDTTSARQAVVVARPDRVRVEVLSMLGTAFLLVADHGQLTAYVRDEHTVYRGTASPRNLARYARIGLPIEALVDLLLATPPAGDGGRRADVSFDPQRGAVLLQRTSDGETYRVWFSDTALPVAAEVCDAAGDTEWRARFEEYREAGGLAVATHVGVELPASAQAMDLVLQDVDVNPPVDPSVFALQVPPGSRLVELQGSAD